MQPQNVKFTYVQINMKQLSYLKNRRSGFWVIVVVVVTFNVKNDKYILIRA